MPRRSSIQRIDPRLSYLVSFITVVEAGGLRRAAKKLALSPVAVMKHIKILENYFGVKLLYSHSSQVTPEGEEIYKVVKRIVEELNLVRGLTSDFDFEEKCKVLLKVYTTETPAEWIAPCLLLNFKKINPNIDFKIEVSCIRGVIDALKKGSADLGILMVDKQSKKLLRAFDKIKLFNDRLVVVHSPFRVISRNHPIDLRTLLKYPFILDRVGSDNYTFVENLLRANGIDPGSLRVKIVLRGAPAILTAVSQDLGISILSELSALKCLRARTITTRPLRGAATELSIYLVKLRGICSEPTYKVWTFAKKFKKTYQGIPPCIQRFTFL